MGMLSDLYGKQVSRVSSLQVCGARWSTKFKMQSRLCDNFKALCFHTRKFKIFFMGANLLQESKKHCLSIRKLCINTECL